MKKTDFIGKIGNDMFGTQLTNALKSVGVGVKGLKTDHEINTTLAFVHTKEDGDREYSFYRNPGADMMLCEEDLEEDYETGIRRIQEEYQIPLILLSMGKDGNCAYCGDARVEVPAVLQEGTIETTGAGDTFGACVLNYVLEHGWKECKKEELEEMLKFANAAASIITTRKGALAVMPTREEVELLLKRL